MTKPFLGTLPAQVLNKDETYNLDEFGPGVQPLIAAFQRRYEELTRRCLDGNLQQVRNWVDQKDAQLAREVQDHDADIAQQTKAIEQQTAPIEREGVATKREINSHQIKVGYTKLERSIEQFETKMARQLDPRAYADFCVQWCDDTVTSSVNLRNQLDTEYDAFITKARATSTFLRDPRGKQLKTALHATPDYQRFTEKKRRLWFSKGAKGFYLLGITGSQFTSSLVGPLSALNTIKLIGASWRNFPRAIVLYKTCMEDLDTQARTLRKLAGDIKKVQTAFDAEKTIGSSLAKHVSEMASQKRMREHNLRNLNEVLFNAQKIQDMGPNQIAPKMVAEARAVIAKYESKKEKLERYNARAEQLLQQLQNLQIALPDAAFNAPANTFLSNVKKYFFSLKGQGEIGTWVHDVEAGGFFAHTEDVINAEVYGPNRG
jgi:hypothetical protein